VLGHVELIDGTGTAPRQDMRIDIAHGKIVAVGPPATHRRYPPDAQRPDLSGKTVIRGLVGLHEHLILSAAGAARGRSGLLR
jgi:imidazolonepropionase-like amidohydrolase